MAALASGAGADGGEVKMRKVRSAMARLRKPKEVEALDVYTTDVVHLLHRYAAGVEDVLQHEEEILLREFRAYQQASTVRSGAVPGAAGGSPAPAEAGPKESGCPQQKELLRIQRIAERYGNAMHGEHERLLAGREEISQAHSGARRQEIEMVKRHYSDPEGARLQAVVEDKVKQHLANYVPEILTDDEGKPVTPEQKAKAEWSTEVSRAVVQDLRQEWRSGQKKLLMHLARELRHERQAAADILEKQSQAWQQLAKVTQAAWSAELKKTQEQLDKLAEGYRKALQVLFEAELREVKQHVAEQADFFKGEIREALKTEQAEQTRNCAQIRRMQIAVLKWQFDYIRDAEQKAEDCAARRRVGALDGCDPWEQFEADGDDGEDGDLQDDAALMAQRVLARVPTRQGQTTDPVKQRLLAESLRRCMLRRLRGQEAAESLGRCQRVVGQIHARVPAAPEDVREFLLKVEAAVPASSEVIRLYEEHLAEHGILAALATAGRPPEAAAGPSGQDPSPSPGGGPSSPRSPPGSPRRGRRGGGRGLG